MKDIEITLKCCADGAAIVINGTQRRITPYNIELAETVCKGLISFLRTCSEVNDDERLSAKP